MTDLVSVVPDLDAASFSNILPSLERNGITCSDLLTLDAVEIAKHTHVPARDVRRLASVIVDALHVQFTADADRESTANAASLPSKALKTTARRLQGTWNCISILDERLDAALNGGLHVGYLTELTGESGTAKTTLLHTLLLSVQLDAPRGLAKSAIYISTETPLQTSRLTQSLKTHPFFSTLSPKARPTLERILSIQTPNLETQDHILRYQLPIAISRHDIGLVVIDSITSNFRAEYDRSDRGRAGPEAMARRGAQLMEVAHLLRELAWRHNIAVVVANQVADRFAAPQPSPLPTSSMSTSEPSDSQSALSQSLEEEGMEGHEPMTLDHQQRWFTGWGDLPASKAATDGRLKTPSLGLVWTNQLGCRIALTRKRGSGERRLKIVFAPWCSDSAGEEGIKFAIGERGVYSLGGEV